MDYEADGDGVVPNTQVRAWSMRADGDGVVHDTGQGMVYEADGDGVVLIQQVRARRGPNTCSSRDRKCLHCIWDPLFYSFPAASNREPCSRTPPHIGLQTACTHRTRGCWRVEGEGRGGEGRGGEGRGGEGRGGEGRGGEGRGGEGRGGEGRGRGGEGRGGEGRGGEGRGGEGRGGEGRGGEGRGGEGRGGEGRGGEGRGRGSYLATTRALSGVPKGASTSASQYSLQGLEGIIH